MRFISRRPYLLSTVASLAWLGACGTYLVSHYGALTTGLGDIAAGGAGTMSSAVTAVSVPLVFAWLWARGRGAAPAATTGAISSSRLTNMQVESERLAQSVERSMASYETMENKLYEQAGQLEEMSLSMAGRVDDITRALDDQAARLFASEERIQGLFGSMDSASEAAQSTTEMVAKLLDQPVESAAERMDEAAARVRAHVDDLFGQLQNLESAYGTTREMAEGADQALNKRVHDIEHVGAKAATELQGFAKSLDPQIDMIEQLGRRASERTEQLQDRIDGQAVALEKVGERLAEQGDMLTNAVSGQATKLDDLRSTVDELSQTISTQFQNQVDALLETSESAGERVAAQAEKGTKAMQERLTDQAKALESQVNVLLQTTETAGARVAAQAEKGTKAMQDRLTDQAKALEGQVSVLLQATETAGELVAAQAEKGTKAMQDSLSDHAKALESQVDALLKTSESAGQHVVAQAEKGTKAMQKRLTDQAKALETTTQSVTEAVDGVCGKMDRRIKEMQNAAGNLGESVEGAAKTAIESLKEKTKGLKFELADFLDNKSGETAEMLNERLGVLNTAIERMDETLTSQGVRFNESVTGQLTQSAELLDNKLGEIRSATDVMGANIENSSKSAIKGLMKKIDGFAETVEERFKSFEVDSGDLETRLDTSLTMIETRMGEVANQLNAQFIEEQGAFATNVNKRSMALMDSFMDRIREARSNTDDEIARLDIQLMDATDRIKTKLNETTDGIHEQFSETTARLDSDLNETTGRIETKLNETTDGIKEQFSETTARLDSDLMETTGRLEARMAETVLTNKQDLEAQIAASLDASQKQAKEINSLLSEATQSAVEKLEERVGGSVSNLTQQLVGIEDRAGLLNDALKGNVDNLLSSVDQSFSALVTKSEELGATTQAAMLESISDASAGLGDLDKQSKSLNDKVKNRLGGIVKAFGGSIEEVDHKSALIADGMKEKFDAVKSNVDGLDETFKANGEAAFERLQSLVNSYSADLTNVTQSAVAGLIEVGRELPEIAEQLGRTADEASLKARDAGQVYEGQTEELARLSTELLSFGGRVREELVSVPDDMTKAVKEIEEAIAQKTGDLSDQHVKMEALISDSNARFEDSQKLLSARLEEFGGLFEELQRYNRNIADVVSEQAQSIAASTEHAKEAWKEARVAIEDQNANASVLADQYIEKMDTISRRARMEIGEIQEMSETATRSVERVTADTSANISNLSEMMGGLQNLLEDMGGNAELQAARITEQHASMSEAEQRKQQHFLENASGLVAQLNRMAIDVEYIVDGEVPADVLKAYEKGDRGISVRRLLKRKSAANSNKKVADAYSKGGNLRSQIDSYCDTFEQLLRSAKSADNEGVMHTTMLTGDLGKLYLFLKDSLEAKRAA